MEPAPLLPFADEWNWQLASKCRGMDVEIFFHPASERRRQKQRRIDRAKAICQDCPVLEECRQQALRTREPYGIWGGLSEEERAEILGLGNLRYPAQRSRNRATSDPIGAPSQQHVPLPHPRPGSASSA